MRSTKGRKDPPGPAHSAPDRGRSPVRTQKTSGQVLALVVPDPEPAITDAFDEVADPTKPSLAPKASWRRWIIVGATACVLIGAIVATALLVYQQAEQKKLRKKLTEIRSMVRLDTAVAYTEAARALRILRRDRPDSARIAVQLALTEAVLWGRFGGGPRARRAAIDGLKASIRLKAEDEQVETLKGYLALYRGNAEEAAATAERALVRYRDSAPLRYVLGVARIRLGDLDAAEATLSSMITTTFSTMLTIRRISNQRPAGVSDSKMTS